MEHQPTRLAPTWFALVISLTHCEVDFDSVCMHVCPLLVKPRKRTTLKIYLDETTLKKRCDCGITEL